MKLPIDSPENIDEIDNLLIELEWLIEDCTPSQWRIFSRIYATRGAAQKALRQVRNRLRPITERGRENAKN